MLNYIHEVKRQLATYFPGCRVTVEKRPSYDCGDDYLALYIWSTWDVEETMQRLDRFDEEWLLDNPEPGDTSLVVLPHFVDVEPIHPPAHRRLRMTDDNWLEGEREVDEDIAAGRFKIFNTMEELLADLFDDSIVSTDPTYTDAAQLAQWRKERE